MDFSIPTNWQEDIILDLVSKNTKGEIKEVYGKLALDDIGGGRTASTLAFVSQEQAKEHIRELRNQGFRFNYLLNTLCMDNLEFTRQGQKRIRHLLDWLVKIGIDLVTVANPYLMMWIKKNYPFISITVSALANIDSMNRAKFWEDLGAHKITFPGPIVNRNFSLIKLLRKSLKCKMQLIANNACLCNCPTYINHALMNSHASQTWHKCGGYMFDYHLIMCRLRRLKNPINFIRSDWIRPEDIAFYEELGVDSIKLVDRRLPTHMILKIISAYLNRSYQGNLVDLFHTLQGKTFNVHKGWINKLFYLRNPFSMNPAKILKFSQLLSEMQIFIDNKQLDGFLKNMPKECNLTTCDTCGYCKIITNQAVKIDENYLKNMLTQYKEVIDRLLQDGLSFSLLKRKIKIPNRNNFLFID